MKAKICTKIYNNTKIVERLVLLCIKLFSSVWTFSYKFVSQKFQETMMEMYNSFW